MLTNNIENELFNLVESVVKPLGYNTVEVNTKSLVNEIKISVTLNSSTGIGLEDCSKASRLLMVVLTNFYETKDVSLEVGSPGLTRHIKDVYEFSLFKGKKVRVYSLKDTCYYHGEINEYKDDVLTLVNVSKDENKEINEKVEINLIDIKKAQLEENS